MGLCKQRQELFADYQNACHELSVNASRLHIASRGTDRVNFKQILAQTEESRLKTENARLTLRFHQDEHGCY